MLFVVLLTGDQAPNQDGVPHVPQAQDKGALLSPSDSFPNLPLFFVFYPGSSHHGCLFGPTATKRGMG